MPAPAASATHLVLIPSYDSGELVVRTVRAARAAWNPVWVVFDGSRDGSDEALARVFAGDGGVRIFRLPFNQGKGAAVLHGLCAAQASGFTHALVMDADDQHPADHIARFMALSIADPGAMILGCPVFGAEAPRLRVQGRRISNFWVRVETLWADIGDSLFGFRVYPIAPLVSIMDTHRWMRRFDFDVEAVVRLSWRGVRAVSVDAPVRYLGREEGGVSHFRYLRDNALLTWMHARLLAGFLVRLPALLARRLGAEVRPSRR
ncbi:MAG: glycosyltransferase family 2 protein [Burkholderiales bacterium]|nr:glycosyltransferase family 2 protein [Burkholderiales bacterium]OJX05293.1 MAG: glycosyl transferase family 2 [Burkholderiales bacterium 70-64]